ncbi:Beta-lactamase enzyme family protein [Arcanobacterium phocae]|uniref:Beta-lactamase enzyme family protein n=1 Tax=Arcanobacterium phocae TaxID=131112 RepID=A0A1H2LB09_9ACTO|nr:serine hydrolase [Arcanobacterium phocae]SDU78183.1 Beta-lactamase enzyme family protein [Arcanobacterium phocae]
MAFKHSSSFKRCATVCILVVSSLATVACSVTPNDEQSKDYSETTESADQSAPAYEPSLEGLLGRVDRINSNKLILLPHTPQLSAPLKAKLTAQIKAIKKAGANVGILMIDTETGQGLAYNAETQFYGASTIKGPYVVAINKFLADDVTEADETLMYNAIEASDNEAYIALRTNYGDDLFSFFADNANAPDIDREEYYPYLSTKELTALWAEMYDYFFLNPNDRAETTRDFFTSPYNSFIYQSLGDEYTTYTKPGWIDIDPIARNDAGIIETDDGTYLLAIMSTAFNEEEKLMDLTTTMDEIHQDLKEATSEVNAQKP